jgi:hypothetical protein
VLDDPASLVKCDLKSDNNRAPRAQRYGENFASRNFESGIWGLRVSNIALFKQRFTGRSVEGLCVHFLQHRSEKDCGKESCGKFKLPFCPLAASLRTQIGHVRFAAFGYFRWRNDKQKVDGLGRFCVQTTRGSMKSIIKALAASAGLAAFAFSPANAYEGGTQWQQKPGVFIGSSAGVPPPGIYMFDQVFTYQTNVAGPVTNAIGTRNAVQAAVDIQGFVFVPGWTFLGATYDAVIAQPFGMVSVGQPLSLVPGQVDQFAGMHNTYIVPVELSWKLGTSGFVIKTGLGIFLPTGTVQGGPGINIPGTTGLSLNGFSNFGNKYWTFQPEAIFSYLKDGWNLSAAVYGEFNTANQIDNYTQGDVFHVDFTATKTIGKWTFGPVGYYAAQVSDDKCSDAICLALHPLGIVGNTQRWQLGAVGGLVEYNFGAATLSVWATQEVFSKASGAVVPANALGPGLPAAATDLSATTKGTTVFATLSYRLWGPEEPAKTPLIHK